MKNKHIAFVPYIFILINKHIAFVPYIFILIFAVILSACSSSEKEVAPQQGQVDSVQTEEAEQKEDNHESEDDLQAFLTSPTLPNDTKSFLQYPSGKFSMRNYDENQEVIEEELSQWPALAKENGEEEVKQYFGNVLALFVQKITHIRISLLQNGKKMILVIQN